MSSLAAEFFARTGHPSKAQFDFLIAQGVPVMALAHDPDGEGYAVGVARIEKCGRRFEFREDGATALVIVARDRDGDDADLIAWLPKDGWFGPWFDALPFLGFQTLDACRLGEPLPVFLDPLDWLRHDRDGVLILQQSRTWSLTEGLTVAAASVEDGLKLKKILETPRPKIVVRASTEMRAAA